MCLLFIYVCILCFKVFIVFYVSGVFYVLSIFSLKKKGLFLPLVFYYMSLISFRLHNYIYFKKIHMDGLAP